MKKHFPFACILLLTMVFTKTYGQEKSVPWSDEQLMAPAKLAIILADSSEQSWPLIIAVNPDGMHGLPFKGGVKGSKWFGPAQDKTNLDSLKTYLEPLDRDAAIVFYCGCCPFDMCPNIRPAFHLFQEMGFTDFKLLNVPQNLEIDWMEKGYPMKIE